MTRSRSVVKLQGDPGRDCGPAEVNTTRLLGSHAMPRKRTVSVEARVLSEPWVYNSRRLQRQRNANRAQKANERASRYGVGGRLTAEDVRVAMEPGVCFYCGTTKQLSIDHVVPLVSGGPNTRENLVACCVPCNDAKGISDIPGRWSTLHDACRECGTTARRHMAHGLCKRCYARFRKAAQ